MNRPQAGLMAGICCIVFSSSVFAENHSRQLDSHEHGHATLNIAVDESQLLIEMESPAVNIIGFEHEPENDDQKAALSNAVAILGDAAKVFTLPAKAGCSATDVDVEAPHDDHEDEKHDDHKDEKHDDHKDEKHDDHKDEKHADHDEETHSEFHVTWVFKCTDIQKVDIVKVNIFSLFPGTEELDANIIGLNGQTSKELTASDNDISL